MVVAQKLRRPFKMHMGLMLHVRGFFVCFLIRKRKRDETWGILAQVKITPYFYYLCQLRPNLPMVGNPH